MRFAGCAQSVRDEFGPRYQLQTSYCPRSPVNNLLYLLPMVPWNRDLRNRGVFADVDCDILRHDALLYIPNLWVGSSAKEQTGRLDAVVSNLFRPRHSAVRAGSLPANPNNPKAPSRLIYYNCARTCSRLPSMIAYPYFSCSFLLASFSCSFSSFVLFFFASRNAKTWSLMGVKSHLSNSLMGCGSFRGRP